MFQRVWTPLICPYSDNESKITIYDFGVYCAELVNGGDWTCWEIVSRRATNDGSVVETLREMPQDFVPFETYSAQTYTGTVSDGLMRIRGWSILTTEMEKGLDRPQEAPRAKQAPQQHRRQQPSLQASPQSTVREQRPPVTPRHFQESPSQGHRQRQQPPHQQPVQKRHLQVLPPLKPTVILQASLSETPPKTSKNKSILTKTTEKMQTWTPLVHVSRAH